MEDQTDNCHIKIQKKRSLSVDHYGDGTSPSKRRALSLQPLNSDEEQRPDVAGRRVSSATSPPAKQGGISLESVGYDRAKSALRSLLLSGPSSAPFGSQQQQQQQQHDARLQPLPSLDQDLLSMEHQEHPSSSRETSSVHHPTSLSTEAPSPKLPPKGLCKALSAALPATKAARKCLPTLGQKKGDSGRLNTEEKPTRKTPKKCRPSQHLVFVENDGSPEDVTHSEGRAPKRQRRDNEKSTDGIPDDTLQADGINNQPTQKKRRQQSRWTAVNTIKRGDEDGVDDFESIPSQSQGSSSSSCSSQQASNNGREDDNNNPQQQQAETQEEKEEEEEKFYHDLAQRSLDYATTKRGRRCSSNDNGGKSGIVWAGFVEALVFEDTQHNCQLEKGLRQRRQERKGQAKARSPEKTPEEKRKAANERARQWRAKRKREKEEKEKGEKGKERQSVDDTLAAPVAAAAAVAS
ncbi:hypothetical protein PG993_006419 [Apiospora rasikravindrae]|uniref:Uncharacterized protein n=1 Tax=Apiospora rasikravindrae TaxID=990691 RepID=A0ABR1T5M4_9PEZI